MASAFSIVGAVKVLTCIVHPDYPDRSYFKGTGQLVVTYHGHIGQKPLQKLSEVTPYYGRAKQNRVIPHADRAFDLVAGGLEKLLEESRVEAQKAAVLRLLDSAGEFLLKRLLEGQDREFLIFCLIGPSDSAG